MSGWATFWEWVIIVALTTYFGLAVVIMIGGFFDVRKMFRRLNESHAQAGEGRGPEGQTERGRNGGMEG